MWLRGGISGRRVFLSQLFRIADAFPDVLYHRQVHYRSVRAFFAQQLGYPFFYVCGYLIGAGVTAE